jgi:putative membrane protein
MAYLWFKALHIIGVVVWFAGLFYLVRLFVYHAEAAQQPEPAQSILKQQYQLMELRLYRLITTPGMYVTVAMAIAMLVTEPSLLHNVWLHIKLVLVAMLLVYHFYCGRLMRQLANDQCSLSGQQFRILNEVPTLLLFAIVVLAVFKTVFPLNTLVLALLGLTVVMGVTIQLYAKKRRQAQELSA